MNMLNVEDFKTMHKIYAQMHPDESICDNVSMYNEELVLFLKLLSNDDNDAEKIDAMLASGHVTNTIMNYYLIESTQHGKLELLHALLKHGANVHSCDDKALRLAVENCNADIVKILLEHEANVHACDDEALQLAVANCNIDIIALLLVHGANVRARNDKALRLAVANCHVEIVALLLAHGANIHCNNNALLLNLNYAFDKRFVDTVLSYCKKYAGFSYAQKRKFMVNLKQGHNDWMDQKILLKCFCELEYKLVLRSEQESFQRAFCKERSKSQSKSTSTQVSKRKNGGDFLPKLKKMFNHELANAILLHAGKSGEQASDNALNFIWNGYELGRAMHAPNFDQASFELRPHSCPSEPKLSLDIPKREIILPWHFNEAMADVMLEYCRESDHIFFPNAYLVQKRRSYQTKSSLS